MNKHELTAYIQALPDDLEIEKSSIDVGYGKVEFRAPQPWEDATIRLRLRVRPVVVSKPVVESPTYRSVCLFTVRWSMASGSSHTKSFETIRQAASFVAGNWALDRALGAATTGASISNNRQIVWALDPASSTLEDVNNSLYALLTNADQS